MIWQQRIQVSFNSTLIYSEVWSEKYELVFHSQSNMPQSLYQVLWAAHLGIYRQWKWYYESLCVERSWRSFFKSFCFKTKSHWYTLASESKLKIKKITKVDISNQYLQTMTTFTAKSKHHNLLINCPIKYPKKLRLFITI